MNAPISLPSLLQPHLSADNGLYPDAAFYGQATAALNHLVAYARKPVFQYTNLLGASGGASGVVWRWHCRTGYGVRRLVVMAVLGRDDRAIAVDPYITVTVTEVGGAALPALTFRGGASEVVATDAPDELLTSTQTIDVDPATEYTGEVEFFDNVRVVSLLVYEEPNSTVTDAVDYFSEYMPAAGSPIQDSWVGRQLAATGALIRYNGGLRADWARFDGSTRTRSSATNVNLLDNSSTGTPTAATPGYTFCTTAKNTASKTTVPIRLAVNAKVAGGGSGTVRLRDTSGNDAAVVTVNSGTQQWFTVDGAISVGSAQKYDLMFAGDGVNIVTVYAVSIYEKG